MALVLQNTEPLKLNGATYNETKKPTFLSRLGYCRTNSVAEVCSWQGRVEYGGGGQGLERERKGRGRCSPALKKASVFCWQQAIE
jgi:hypothetical protein